MSAAIRWQTRSQYSHAAIQLEDGSIIESWQGDGVRRKYLSDWEGVDVFDIAGAPDLNEEEIKEFLLDQLGKGYDYRSVLRFLTKKKGDASKSWFCSELVFEAVKAGGLNLLERVEGWQVSPSVLSFSPCLVPSKKYGKDEIFNILNR